MKKLFTILSAMLFAAGAFAATEPAWYNDVTSIEANGQYYIYSVGGQGFVQAGQGKVKAVTSSNYSSNSDLLFTVTKAEDGKAFNGTKYLSSYQAGTCGPTGSSSDGGSNLVWTAMSNNTYWNIHGKYNFLGTKYAALYYENNGYAATANVWGNKDTQTDTKYQWLLISQGQYDRHWAIYLFDVFREGKSITAYQGTVPAAYYTAMQTLMEATYDVHDTNITGEQIRNNQITLKGLFDNVEAVQAAYATANTAVNNLEAVEDKGEDFAQITSDITAARTAIEAAMTVDALNAAVAGLKAIDPITFSQTTFVAISSVANAASSVAGRAIVYDAANKAIINAQGKAIYAGTTTLTATAAATEQYYKFVRSAQVTVTAPTTYGDFVESSCDTPVEFHNVSYSESFAGDVNVGKNYMGGDSIVHVSITIKHATTGEETKTIVLGAEESWNGIDLSTYGLGTHDVPFETTNVAGCDSTVTLHLTVIKSDAVEEEVELEFCQGGSVEYRDRTYTSAGTDVINVTGDERDTVINVTIIELLPSASEDEMTIVYGADEEWNGIALKDSTVGVHYVVYETTNAAGCDSIVTLTLTVTKQEAFVEERQLEFCEGDSVEYRGKVYTEAGEDTYEIEGATRDTLVVVTIAVNPNAYEKLEQTVLSGHEIVLPEGEWMIGEETVSGTYPTVKSGESTTLTFFQYGQTEKGCEDVKELVVTVESNTEAVDNIFVGEKAEKVFRNGVLYIRRGERIFTCEGREVK